MKLCKLSYILFSLISLLFILPGNMQAETFSGQFYSGAGDVEYLELLDIARRMFEPDPEYQNLSMLYTPSWNGLVEGPTWDAWWIPKQLWNNVLRSPRIWMNRSLHFYKIPRIFGLIKWEMGKPSRPHKHFQWIPPDGCLCDAARPTDFIAKQGDGRVDIHDWGMEFTAAGLLMQAELLLISRDTDTIEQYIPKLERCANFLGKPQRSKEQSLSRRSRRQSTRSQLRWI